MSLPLPDAEAWGATPSSLPSSPLPASTTAFAAPDDLASPADGPGGSGGSALSTALAKDAAIKDIVTLRDGLRGLLVRLAEVEADVDKGQKENEMLGVYIDNLTRNSVVAAGQKR